jgi:valyl-tRNA synthetase
MLGDVAVAVHPDDERFRNLIGSEVILPLVERRIPIIADDYVDPEFGTGCLKITPAHDFNDYEVGARHGLEPINIFTVDAAINDTAPAPYRGLDRFAARQRVVADLESRSLLESVQPHRLMVPRGDRSHCVIEPYLTDQWFVKAGPLAEAAIAAVEDGRIRFVPEHWSKTYFEWMRNIEDWCISRQIWWGHRIPAWYDGDGNIYVGHDEEEVRTKHRLGDEVTLARDPDVLDTWYSSALWPFSTLGWPDSSERLATFYPGSVLVTGFDIIFFWVARMIMMGLKFMDDVPFREVYIHGLVRDADGNKMSKSKGTIPDPLDLIDGIELEPLVRKRTTGLMQPQLAPSIDEATRRQFPDGIPAYGTDALRFTFCSLATQGRDVRFDLKRIAGYRNFCNKLWNAARFVLTRTEGEDCGQGEEPVELGLAERWIVSRLQVAEQAVVEGVENYRLDLAAQAIYEFTWSEYCDWYIELSKPVLMGEHSTAAARRGTRRTLIQVLETLLRVTHPLMPYITEAVWQQVAPLAGCSGDTIMRQPYPTPDPRHIDATAVEDMGWVQDFVLGIRRIRGEMDVSPARRVAVLARNASEDDRRRIDVHRLYLDALAGLDSIRVLESGESVPESATTLLGSTELLIPLAGLIDKDAESARLAREIDKRAKDLARCQAKLANPSFVDRAPAEVVARERERVAELTGAVAKLEEQRAALDRI